MCDLKQGIPEVLLCAAGKAEGGESGADKGRGPRIYVGGIPTAVSETMVRNHFSQWGQVTTKCPLMHMEGVCVDLIFMSPGCIWSRQLCLGGTPTDYTLNLIQQYTKPKELCLAYCRWWTATFPRIER